MVKVCNAACLFVVHQTLGSSVAKGCFVLPHHLLGVAPSKSLGIKISQHNEPVTYPYRAIPPCATKYFIISHAKTSFCNMEKHIHACTQNQSACAQLSTTTFPSRKKRWARGARGRGGGGIKVKVFKCKLNPSLLLLGNYCTIHHAQQSMILLLMLHEKSSDLNSFLLGKQSFPPTLQLFSERCVHTSFQNHVCFSFCPGGHMARSRNSSGTRAAWRR